jgi:putative acetyltransferase
VTDSETSEPLVRLRGERAGDRDDVAAVRAVNLAAFAGDDEARLLDALHAAGDYDAAWSLVAEVDGEIVGHCLLTAATLERPDGTRVVGRIAALGPMAVVPAWQRRGIGSRLVRAALELCRERGAAAVVLVGHPSYYPRFGFRPARPQGLLPPAHWRDEVWMAVRLPAWTPADAGIVHYAPAFMEMD